MRPYSLHPNILVFAWSIRRPSRRVVSAPRQRRGREIPMATMSKGNSGWPVAAWVSTTPATTTRRPSTTVRQSPATMTTSLPVLAARHRHAHQRVAVRRHRYLVQHRFRSVAGLDQSIGNRLRKPDGDRGRRQKASEYFRLGAGRNQSDDAFTIAGLQVETSTRSVPEPGTLALLGAGRMGLRLLRRRNHA